MNVVGEGDAKMSIVARSDLSRFIGHRDQVLPRLEPHALRGLHCVKIPTCNRVQRLATAVMPSFGVMMK
jgi:hypothetical protein